jgi:hypothetical protein
MNYEKKGCPDKSGSSLRKAEEKAGGGWRKHKELGRGIKLLPFFIPFFV